MLVSVKCFTWDVTDVKHSSFTWEKKKSIKEHCSFNLLLCVVVFGIFIAFHWPCNNNNNKNTLNIASVIYPRKENSWCHFASNAPTGQRGKEKKKKVHSHVQSSLRERIIVIYWNRNFIWLYLFLEYSFPYS